MENSSNENIVLSHPQTQYQKYKGYINEYYLKNKDKITEKKRAKVICDRCQRSVSHQYYNKHRTSLFCSSHSLDRVTPFRDVFDEFFKEMEAKGFMITSYDLLKKMCKEINNDKIKF